MTGWDRPLSSFFLQIGHECECDDDENCGHCGGAGEVWIYDNLADKQLPFGRMTLTDVDKKLATLLTAWPSDVIRALQADQLQDRGNEITRYDAVGEIK